MYDFTFYFYFCSCASVADKKFSGSPLIHYFPFQSLMNTEWNNALRHAYCNLRIEQYIITRDKLSKEIVPPAQSKRDSEELFEDALKSWENDSTCKQLKSIFSSIGSPEVDKIIGFACGTLRSTNDGRDKRQARCRATQHALLLTLKDIFMDRSGPTKSQIGCYVQDPGYSSIDKSIFKGHDISTLDDPRAFLAVDASACVVSCAPDAPIKEIVSDLARPAVLIWNQVYDEDRETFCSDPDSPRLRTMMLEFYDKHQFPGDREVFGDIAIYVRRK